MKTLDQDFPPIKLLAPELEKAANFTNGLAKLREPFPAHQISKLPKPTKKQTDEVKADYRKGIRCQICGTWHHPDVIHLDYVGHAALTDRLLDSDPSWYWEPLSISPEGIPVRDKEGGMWIKLTVCGVTRLGYGHAGDKTGGDAIKEIIGDALRNAAMRFGAALELWHKGDLHKPEQDEEDSAEEAEWADNHAMKVRSFINDANIVDAAAYINGLGIGGSYDAEAKEAVWGRLESNIRSAIKAYDAITQSQSLDALKRAWEAAPKHSHKMLESVKDEIKDSLSQQAEATYQR